VPEEFVVRLVGDEPQRELAQRDQIVGAEEVGEGLLDLFLRVERSRLLNGSSVADQVLQAAGDLPVQVVNVGRPDKASREWRRQDITSGGG
jgi:hypothetical protein